MVQLLKRTHRSDLGEARPSEEHRTERGRPEVVRRFLGELRAIELVDEGRSLIGGDHDLLGHDVQDAPSDALRSEHARELLRSLQELSVALLDAELPGRCREHSPLPEHAEEIREQILHGDSPFRSSVEKPLDGFCCIL